MEKLTKANLRFVVSVAKQYQNQGLSFSDLINEWNLWLIKAAQRFDETRGFKFISYAVWRIRQSILQALAEQARIVRLPLNKVWLVNKINKAISRFEQEHERLPDLDEIAELLDITMEEAANIMALKDRHSSLDAPTSPAEDAQTLYDKIPAHESDSIEDSMKSEFTRQAIMWALNKFLTPKQKQIMIRFYGLDGNESLTLEAIGEKCTPVLTRERVRQIKEKAKWRLRAAGGHDKDARAAMELFLKKGAAAYKNNFDQYNSDVVHYTAAHQTDEQKPSLADIINSLPLTEDEKNFAIHWLVNRDEFFDEIIHNDIAFKLTVEAAISKAKQLIEKLEKWESLESLHWKGKEQLRFTGKIHHRTQTNEGAVQSRRTPIQARIIHTHSQHWWQSDTDTMVVESEDAIKASDLFPNDIPETQANINQLHPSSDSPFTPPKWLEDLLQLNKQPFIVVNWSDLEEYQQAWTVYEALLQGKKPNRSLYNLIRIADFLTAKDSSISRYVCSINTFKLLGNINCDSNSPITTSISQLADETIGYTRSDTGEVVNVPIFANLMIYRKKEPRPQMIDFTLSDGLMEVIRNPKLIQPVPSLQNALEIASAYTPFSSFQAQALHKHFTDSDLREHRLTATELKQLIDAFKLPHNNNATTFKTYILDKIVAEINRVSELQISYEHKRIFAHNREYVFTVQKNDIAVDGKEASAQPDEPIAAAAALPAPQNADEAIERMDLNHTQKKVARHLFVKTDVEIQSFAQENIHFHETMIEIGLRVKKELDNLFPNSLTVFSLTEMSDNSNAITPNTPSHEEEQTQIYIYEPASAFKTYGLLASHIDQEVTSMDLKDRTKRFFDAHGWDISLTTVWYQKKLINEALLDLNKNTDMIVAYWFEWEANNEDIVFKVGIKWHMAKMDLVVPMSRRGTAKALLDTTHLQQQLDSIPLNEMEKEFTQHMFIERNKDTAQSIEWLHRNKMFAEILRRDIKKILTLSE